MISIGLREKLSKSNLVEFSLFVLTCALSTRVMMFMLFLFWLYV